MVASLLIMVMLSTSVSGYYSTGASTITEWQKLTVTPAVVTDAFVVPTQRAVLYVVNTNMTSKGVTPEITARCNSPGSPLII